MLYLLDSWVGGPSAGSIIATTHLVLPKIDRTTVGCSTDSKQGRKSIRFCRIMSIFSVILLVDLTSNVVGRTFFSPKDR